MKNSVNNKKITVVYSLDHIDQVEPFLNSSYSLFQIRDNIENVQLLLFLTENIFNQVSKKISTFFINLSNDIVFKIYKIDFKTGATNSIAKFAWIFSPFKASTEYIIRLDSDTIVNAKLHDIVENYKNEIDNNLLLGKSDPYILSNSQWGEPIKFALGIKDPHSHGNYIDTGVVLMNRERALESFISQESLFNRINNLRELFKKENFFIQESDQNILYTLYGDKFSSNLDKIYNYSPKTTLNRNEMKMFKKSNIIHYNIWYFNWFYGQNRKLDMNFWFSLGDDEASRYVRNFYMLQKNKADYDSLSGFEKKQISDLLKFFKTYFSESKNYVRKFMEEN